MKKKFEGIHDRFQNDSAFRDSQLRIDRTEDACIQMGQGRAKRFQPIACRKTSTPDAKRIGGSLSTHLDAMNRVKLRSDFSESVHKIAPSFTVSLEKSDSHRFLPG